MTATTTSSTNPTAVGIAGATTGALSHSPPPTPSATNLIDGKLTAATIREEVKQDVLLLFSSQQLRSPCLAVVLVGDRKDSSTYVRMKQRACEECGISSRMVQIKETCTQQELAQAVNNLNADKTVDGILVQLPLPSQICEKDILSLINSSKDVDGLHPLNVGKLALRGYTPMFKPCTAEGVIELLKRYHVNMSGAHAVVIGRSNIVGTPVALLLQQQDCTVTICHSKTKDISQHVRLADIVVAAVGSARFVKASWLKDGVVVVDVGINVEDDNTNSKGYRLVGDVDFHGGCSGKAKLITPVPGGVGPMTVAILMRNAVQARKRSIENEQ
eukprot:GHVS01102866.1.p1 GENE.GHVS01102866.1~~GHVS01102866.1.p1  ORF type:complete len:330 (+),score=61.39 GHVS01102866.1:382-1371(+)